MNFPLVRMRRLRNSSNIRQLVSETTLSISDMIQPLFVIHGENKKEEIPSMPGQYHLSIDNLVEESVKIHKLGIPAILLFGMPLTKDPRGSEALSPSGIVQQAVRALKKNVPDLCVITDICLCAYTDHGHCGIVQGNSIMNDDTLDLLRKVALSHAQAGADMVAPSDMMDGRVLAIRQILDANNFSHIPIMSYSAKYASAFYGPFRQAADSAPAFGDRSTYQANPANRREAVREAMLDLQEGADIVMVKPALAYLDVIKEIRNILFAPIAAYNVSGEYSMVKAAAMNGWLDERRVVMELLTSIKRAGADMIITYHARDVARWLKGESADEKEKKPAVKKISKNESLNFTQEGKSLPRREK